MSGGLTDQQFALIIREARERLKMSQGELARQMAARGFPYYQQTIRRIEEGRRKVSVGEAVALAVTLRMDGALADLGAGLAPAPCPCCNDKPPAGMTCQECGAEGESFRER